MKKIYLFALSLIVSMCLFCLNAFAVDTTPLTGDDGTTLVLVIVLVAVAGVAALFLMKNKKHK